jgi:hypothetical protein
MFALLKARLPEREGILFIRQDNEAFETIEYVPDGRDMPASAPGGANTAVIVRYIKRRSRFSGGRQSSRPRAAVGVLKAPKRPGKGDSVLLCACGRRARGTECSLEDSGKIA